MTQQVTIGESQCLFEPDVQHGCVGGQDMGSQLKATTKPYIPISTSAQETGSACVVQMGKTWGASQRQWPLALAAHVLPICNAHPQNKSFTITTRPQGVVCTLYTCRTERVWVTHVGNWFQCVGGDLLDVWRQLQNLRLRVFETCHSLTESPPSYEHYPAPHPLFNHIWLCLL